MTVGIKWRRFITPLRFKFKHASADRAASSSIIVEINDGEFRGYGESCPRSYVTGETEESVTQFLDQHGNCLLYTSPSPRDQRGSRKPASG